MPSEFVDRILQCQDCSQDFVFTAGEQIFFHEKQFKNDPKRCKACKAKRAQRLNPNTAPGATAKPLLRTETRTSCSECGIETTVPFKPTQGRPVLCRGCFQIRSVVPLNSSMPGALLEGAAAEAAVAMAADAAVESVLAQAEGAELQPLVPSALTQNPVEMPDVLALELEPMQS